MKRTILILLAMALLIPSLAFADEGECVNQDEVIKSWESALIQNEPNTSNVTLAICNTCECWHNGDISSSSYYECLASEARSKENERKKQRDLLDRAKKHGICNETEYGTFDDSTTTVTFDEDVTTALTVPCIENENKAKRVCGNGKYISLTPDNTCYICKD